MKRRQFISRMAALTAVTAERSEAADTSPVWRVRKSATKEFTIVVSAVGLLKNEYVASASCSVRYLGGDNADLGVRTYSVRVPIASAQRGPYVTF
jgi:hypothetical protein